MTILIVSAPIDVHAQAVRARLHGRGSACVILDHSQFPTRLKLSMRFGDGFQTCQLRDPDGNELDLATVSAVWWRRPQGFGLPAAMADPVARQFALAEAQTVFQGLYQSIDARWMNQPALDIVAGHKPYQLRVAQDVGLEIPPTLITNDPDAARAFWERHAPVIHKQFVALPDSWRETRRIATADFAHSDAIAHAPVLFQQHVDAVADLRVIAVGGQLFAAATALGDLVYPQDVRMNSEARYTPHDLPPVIADTLQALMARLGLVYGAIDLRLTPDGRYVFLEINPAGQFLYIERDTGQPIAAAIANWLAGG